MHAITARQREVLEYIRERISEKGYAPTIREVALHFGFSIKAAHDHMRALCKKGFAVQDERRSRSMRLTPHGEGVFDDGNLNIPVIGTVAAGKPIFAEENQEGTVKIHRSLLKDGAEYFILKVKGDSMNLANIVDGDMALIEKRNSVRSGEIIVAFLEDKEEATIKQFFREKNRIRLQPQSSNPEHQPLYQKKGMKILGRCAGVIRLYD
ncbi:MAG: transcriptional repressor LexA [Treponema sp.]|jgi:repressor LexA|nr:transcriptional repressor LexA [Treponema sp.]